jgi:hypothetical protein
MYEIIKSTEPFVDEVIKKTNTDGTISYIPLDESNSDYQAYLRWLENPDAEEGGTL